MAENRGIFFRFSPVFAIFALMNGCRNILPVVAAVVTLMLAVAACGHGGMTEQAARAAVDTVEAHYKAYDVNALRSDSQNIANAVDYYGCCGQSLKAQHDFAQALLCQSKVLEAIGQPKLTLEALKRAETVCPKDDHNLLGHILFKKAYLYACQYTDSIPLALYEAALHQFTLADNEEYQMICIVEMGVARASEKMDSADYYLEKASSKAKSLGKKWHHCRYLTKLAIHHYFLHNYAAAAQLSSHIINGCDSSDIADNGISVYTTAIDAFVKMNKIDSASHYLSIMPAPRDEVDSMNLYYTLSRLNEAQKDYKQSLHYNKLANDINDSIIINSLKLRLFGIETSYDKQQLELTAEKQKTHNYHLVFITMLIAAILLATIILLLRLKKRHSAEVAERLAAIRQMELAIESLKNQQATLERTRTALYSVTGERNRLKKELITAEKVDKQDMFLHSKAQAELGIIVYSELYEKLTIPSGASFFKVLMAKRHSSEISMSGTLSSSFWDNLQQLVDLRYMGYATFLQNNYPQLKTNEIHFVCLNCMGLSRIIIQKCMGFSNAQSVNNMNSKITKQRLKTTLSLDEFLISYLKSVSE